MKTRRRKKIFRKRHKNTKKQRGGQKWKGMASKLANKAGSAAKGKMDSMKGKAMGKMNAAKGMAKKAGVKMSAGA